MCGLCMRMRLCRRGTLIVRANLPEEELSGTLADWLEGMRSRALRRVGIGTRERVLEVGCGHGFVSAELARRSRGLVVALDIESEGLGALIAENTLPVGGDGRRLPFRDESFDLVLFQNTLMWIDPAEVAVAEAVRVLQPGGALIALEPDYGAMIEEPDLGLRNTWLDALERSGADPLMGRRLPGLAEAAGLQTWIELSHIPGRAQPEAVDLLSELPLTVRQRESAEGARAIIERATGSWSVFLHVPYLMLVALRR